MCVVFRAARKPPDITIYANEANPTTTTSHHAQGHAAPMLSELDGRARITSSLLSGQQLREVLARDVDLHLARDLLEAWVLLDPLDDRIHDAAEV